MINGKVSDWDVLEVDGHNIGTNYTMLLTAEKRSYRSNCYNLLILLKVKGFSVFQKTTMIGIMQNNDLVESK